MVEEKLHIGDFQTTDLLYYDADYTEKGYQFCEKRDIDCLPIIGDSEHYYWRGEEKGQFEHRLVEEERRLPAGTDAFQSDLLERFKRFPVQLVYQDGDLSGIVHFSDYNRDIVSQHLYGVLSQYERDLRALARREGRKNSSMAQYFSDKLEEAKAKGDEKKQDYFRGKLEHYDRQKEQRGKLPEFDTFYLEDLLGLLKHERKMKLSGGVTNVRNAIMHAQELVHMRDMTTPDFIYDYDPFARFFRDILELLEDVQRVRNWLKYLDPDWFPEQKE